MNKPEQLAHIAAMLREVCGPGMISLEISTADNITLKNYNPGKYDDAVKFMRDFGVRKRTKIPVASDEIPTYTRLTGVTQNGICVEAFPDGLAPTCRLEKYIEKIPKTQTVATGEFIEIEKTRVVCDERREVDRGA